MTRNLLGGAALAAALLAASPAAAQQHGEHDHHSTPEQPVPNSDPQQGHHSETQPAQEGHEGHDMGSTGYFARSQAGSGTSRIPAADGAMHGLHVETGDWTLMAHGYAWASYTNQGGPRGDEMAVVQSMAMLSASRPIGDGGSVEVRTMLSLDPLMGARGYPLLFAVGETADGESLVDRQHPHDFVMELAAKVELPISSDANLFLYGGPVGEPAIGPGAFMHRASARYNPEAPITHHWFDSTHITFGVVTAGVRTRGFQIEGSAFRGREPDEERWDIEEPALDSWSVRGTWTPSPRWAAQVSFARLEQPEALHPGEDEERLTASVSYADGGLSVTGAFSAKNRLPGPTLNAWLLEANWNLGERHSLFGRVEHVEQDELLDHHDPRHGNVYGVSRATIGYAHRLSLDGPWRLAVGGSASVHLLPDALRPDYGDTPVAFTLFAKVSLGD